MADVVVVGAGVAGLSAAVAAREAGATVTVIERAPRSESGGNTRYTEAYLRMKSIDEVSDDFESALLGDTMGYPDPSLVANLHRPVDAWPATLRALSISDPELVSAFAEQAGPTLRWLTGHGVTFTEISTQFLTTSTTRMAPSGGGLALVEALRSAAERTGVRFEYEVTARSLLGRSAVEGVAGRTASGEVNEYRGQVVLACGGFEGNPEMLARYGGGQTLFCRPVCRGGYHNKGEGIRMALDFGAAPAGNFGNFHAEPIDPRSGISEPSIMAYPYGILVNKQGERFADEGAGPVDASYERVARKIFNQTEGIAYFVVDSKLADVPNVKTAIRTDIPPLRADSIDGLAMAIGVPAAALAETVRAFNSACQPGTFDPTQVDGLSTRGLAPAKSNWARPIDAAPYEAYPIIASNVFTYGGLKVNTHAQVIDQSGNTIVGLYAAGETVGMYFTNYAGSTSVLKGAVFGWISGQHAAGGRGQ